jgi:glycosyltransferase involved in cell wall biosynthesis
VSDGEKQWLIEKAALVLYPSTYEGFGLVPFEAAAVGTPALTTRSTSLVEVLGDQVLYLDTLDPWTGVDVVWALLSRPEVAHRQVEAIKARGLNFTWHVVAEKLWTF